jgi:hypothetical protein
LSGVVEGDADEAVLGWDTGTDQDGLQEEAVMEPSKGAPHSSVEVLGARSEALQECGDGAAVLVDAEPDVG